MTFQRTLDISQHLSSVVEKHDRAIMERLSTKYVAFVIISVLSVCNHMGQCQWSSPEECGDIWHFIIEIQVCFPPNRDHIWNSMKLSLACVSIQNLTRWEMQDYAQVKIVVFVGTVSNVMITGNWITVTVVRYFHQTGIMDIKSSVKRTQGFYSLSSKTSSHQILRSYWNVLSLKLNFNLTIKSNLHMLFLVTFRFGVNNRFYIICSA